jgi:hypothetical protein
LDFWSSSTVAFKSSYTLSWPLDPVIFLLRPGNRFTEAPRWAPKCLANVPVNGPVVFCDWARQESSWSYLSLWLYGN